MSGKKIFGIVLVIIGVILLLSARYISDRVLSGRAEIAAGQRKVESTESMFSMTPQTQQAGKMFTESGRERIAAGQSEADRYDRLAKEIRFGGYALIIAGIIIFILPKRKR